MTGIALAALALTSLLAAPAEPVRGPKPGKNPPQDTAPAEPEPTPGLIFERGRVAYARGEYAQAIATLRPMLYPEIRFENEGQVVQSHRMLGVAHLFEGQPVEAKQEFLRLLELRPDYRFDPLLDSPQVVDFFNSILQEQETQIAAMEAVRREAEAEQRRRRDALDKGPQIIERDYEYHSFAVNFLPFGAGQFQNRQPRKGWFFMITESSLAAVSLGTFAANFAIYGLNPQLCDQGDDNVECPPGTYTEGDVDRSLALSRISVVTGGLFFAVMAWGIADALLHFQERVPLPVAGPGRGEDAGIRVGFFPSVIPTSAGNAVGPGLSLTF
jgi:tetratricopeptide (TPR) repeat protein